MIDRHPTDPTPGVPPLRMAGVGTSSDGLPAPRLLLAGIGSSEEGLPVRGARSVRTTRQGVTAMASMFALGGGFVLGPAVAAADGGNPGSGSTTLTPTSSTGTDTTTTPTTTDTTATATTTTGTSTGPATPTPTTATTDTTTVTTPTATTAPAPTTTTAATTTSTTPATTTGTTTAPAATTTTPTTTTGTTTTPATQPTTVSQTQSVVAGISKTAGQLAIAGAITNGPVAQSEQPNAKRKSGGSGLAKHAAPTPATAPGTSSFLPLGDGNMTPWEAALVNDPLTQEQMTHFADLVTSMSLPPRELITMYKQAARHFRIPWQVLAAINYVETGYGKDVHMSSAGAIGFMQFMPGTWERYGMSVDSKGNFEIGTPNPWDPRDAIFSAARYLVASGVRGNLPKAIYSYNHAGWYVQEVVSIAESINTHNFKRSWKKKRKVTAMRTQARLLQGFPYVWGGGHSTWTLQDGYDCSGFVSAVLHSAGFLRIPVTTQTLPSVPSMRLGKGKYVTIYDRTDGGSLQGDHVIIDIYGQYWESGGGGQSSGMVHQMHRVPRDYLRSFNLVLHPRGL